MARVSQIGFILGLAGIMIIMVGLFPSILGLPPTPGIGVVQILVLLVGFMLLMLGAMIYVKFNFYAHKPLTLLQQVGIRLALTGITFAALVSLADVLGFGSNLRSEGDELLLGPIQLTGMLICFGLASLGVLIFAVAGEPEIIDDGD